MWGKWRQYSSARMIVSTSIGPPDLPLDRCAGKSAGPILDVVNGPLQVRLAATPDDIDAVQALRYRIFYETMGARPLTEMARRMTSGVLQADLRTAVEPTMDPDEVGSAVANMANLPLSTNVLTMTIMATKMPFVGRG